MLLKMHRRVMYGFMLVFVLLILRIFYMHKITCVFLLWNLFLAWVPLAVANIFKQAFTNIMEACFSYFTMAGFFPKCAIFDY